MSLTAPPRSATLSFSICSFRIVILLRVPRQSGRIGKRVRFPHGPATVMLSKSPATGPLIESGRPPATKTHS